VLWSRAFNVIEEDNSSKTFDISSLITTGATPGQLLVHVIGYANNNEQTLDADPVMLTFNAADGTFIRAKRYASFNMAETTRQAIVSHDGNILLCGTAKGPREQDPIQPIGAGSEYGALLMKVQPDSTLISNSRVRGSLEYYCMAESPDGTLFTGGSFARSVILDDIPAFLIGRHPVGGPSLFFGVGEDIANDKYDVITRSTGGDILPNAGNTPWDYCAKLVWTPVGLVAMENTGLGPDRAVTVMCFTEKMSLRWWNTIENTTQEDTFFDATLTNDGIFTVGQTKSFGTTPSGFYAAMINKLPFDNFLIRVKI
jgi:hypothetical protein